MGRVRAVPRLCKLYPGICLTTEEKARKNLSQGSRRMPVGTKTETKQTKKIINVNKTNCPWCWRRPSMADGVETLWSAMAPRLICSIQDSNPKLISQSVLSLNLTSTSTIARTKVTNPMNTPHWNKRQRVSMNITSQNTTQFWNYILR